ncbi:MAG: C-GCAxxG-C-C family protein [Candidatus Methanomethylicaceae archaeon]
MNRLNLKRLETYGGKSAFLEELRDTVFHSEIRYHGCAQILVGSFMRVFDVNCVELFMAASPFVGGIALTGRTCGALIGGLMVAGLVFGRQKVEEGQEGILRGIKPMRKIVKFFVDRYGSVNCNDLTSVDLANPEQARDYFASGGVERCASVMAETAMFVGEIIYGEFEKRKHQGG